MKMKKILFLSAVLPIFIASIFPVAAQERAVQEKVTGFSDLVLFLDPGHYGTYNQGYGGYSEAEKVLRVAHAIKEYLVTYTDMKAENIVLSRESDSDAEISFTERGNICRAIGAKLLYSIHSDAPSVTAYSTLYLYGGRRLVSGGPVVEKLPEGGKQYGDILNANLTSVLRAIRNNGTVVPDNSRGNVADRIFYGGDSNSPYLGVHTGTNGICASLLSEAGFHTNPAQNMQFVNVEHKRMQAYAAYQSLVRYLSEKHLGGRKEPVQVGIATGFVFDGETFAPVNGAKITITEGETIKTYTTDTYASLPKKYSFKPDEFGNGFYWIEGLTPGATLKIKVEADGFAPSEEIEYTVPATVGATTIQGLAVKDIQLSKLIPAKVKTVERRLDMNSHVIQRLPMDIIFDRQMDKASVEEAFEISPDADVSLSWQNDFTLRVNISKLNFDTDYTITIKGSVAKNSLTGQFLDGVGNGTEGSDFVFRFTSCNTDVLPPVIVSYDPQEEQEISSRPIVRIEFDEPLNEQTISPNGQITVTDNAGNNIDGQLNYYMSSNFKSVIHYTFYDDLTPNETYTVKLASGIEDWYGNAMPDDFEFTFTPRPRAKTLVTVIADFYTGIPSGWWDLTGSGSTVDVNKPVTIVEFDNRQKAVNESLGCARADYQWEKTGNPTVRWHNTTTTPKFSTANVIQYYLFGDGSNSTVAVVLRDGGAGDMWGHQKITVDWVGWKQITWDMANDPNVNHVTGSSAMPKNTNLNFSCFWIQPAPLAERYYEISSIFFSQLRVVTLRGYDDFVVTFDSKGGSAVPETYVANGNPLAQPATPVRSGYDFEGWYKDEELTAAWNFTTAVTGNMTLYAKWVISKQANIFAFDLRASAVSAANDVEFSYSLNANASSVTITVSNGDAFEITDAAGLTKGQHKVTRRITEQTAAGDYTWTVKAVGVAETSNTGTNPLKVTTDAPEFLFYSPRGVAVDNSFESPFFGNIYITETGTGGTVTEGSPSPTRAMQNGVYMMNPLLENLNPAGLGTVINAFRGGVEWPTTQGTSPMRVATAPDGKVYITDWSDGNSGVWIMDPANPSGNFTAIFEAGNKADVHGNISHCYVTGTGAGTVLYTADEDIITDGGTTGEILQYNIGDATLPWTTAPSAVIFNDAPNLIVNFTNMIAPGHGGWWMTQACAGNGSETRPCVIHINGNGEIDYNSGSTITTSYGALAISLDGKLIAVPASSGGTIGIYNIDYTAGSAPTLTFNRNVINGGTTNCVAFDHANNLYAVSNASERLTVFAFPNATVADNSFTTPAPASQPVSVTDDVVKTVYTVKFNSMGGTYVSSVNVEEGSAVAKPGNPSFNCNTFVNWCREENLATEYNFNDAVTGNITLYAKWAKIQYNVTFSGSEIAGARVDCGSTLTQPANPTRDGYTFGGWYKEAACTNAWNFTNDAVTGDVTLYAKWGPVTGYETISAVNALIYPNPTDGTFVVEFDSEGDYVITLTDMAGKVLLRKTASDNIVQMDISGYPAGVYLLVIENGAEKSVTKIVKN